MFRLKKSGQSALEQNEAGVAEAQSTQANAVPLPTDLRDALQAALGREVPERLSKKEAELLAREVATKAPSLQRDLIDWMVSEYARKVRSKPAPKTARPAGFLGFFYVRDREGNWVPSRWRFLLAGLVLAIGFTLFLMSLMGGEGGKGGTASPPETPLPTVSASPLPPAVSQPTPAAANASPQPSPPSPPGRLPEGGGQEATSPQAAAPTSPPTPLLPPPPADLPPPPDYEGGGGSAAAAPGGVVVYERPGAQAAGQGEAGGLVTSLQRPTEQAAFGRGTGGGQGAQGGGSPAQESGQGSGFWQRSSGSQQEASSEPFWQREKGDGAPDRQEAFWKRGEGGGSGNEDRGLAVNTRNPASSQGATEVVYQRKLPVQPGGIIPPGGGAGSPPEQPSSPSSTPQPEAPGAGTP